MTLKILNLTDAEILRIFVEKCWYQKYDKNNDQVTMAW